MKERRGLRSYFSWLHFARGKRGSLEERNCALNRKTAFLAGGRPTRIHQLIYTWHQRACKRENASQRSGFSNPMSRARLCCSDFGFSGNLSWKRPLIAHSGVNLCWDGQLEMRWKDEKASEKAHVKRDWQRSSIIVSTVLWYMSCTNFVDYNTSYAIL